MFDRVTALRGGGRPAGAARVRGGRVEELVEARLTRKVLFDRDPTPLIELILERVAAAAVRQLEIQREQLQALAEDSRRDNVCAQVLSLERGLRGTYAGDRGPMKLVETQDHQHVVYLEVEDQGILVSHPTEVSQLAHRYAKIRAQALSPDESLGLIEWLAGEEG